MKKTETITYCITIVALVYLVLMYAIAEDRHSSIVKVYTFFQQSKAQMFRECLLAAKDTSICELRLALPNNVVGD